MSAAKHTPGPWFTVPYGDGDSLVICNDEVGNHRIAFMSIPSSHKSGEYIKRWQEIKANAHLITGAPDLLEALEYAVSKYGQEGGPWNVPSDPGGWLDRARAAIAKAKGE